MARTVKELVQVVPDSVKMALAALAGLCAMLGVGYLLAVLRSRRLERHRRVLVQEVGALQSALLPPVPETLGGLHTSVAYRPADGPAAGGDFYDAVALPGGRSGFVLGDVSGHGRPALERTAFLRYTLCAYLEAGLDPRTALQVAGRVVSDRLGGDFATVLLAVHDPASGSLTYASAGHPAPIVTAPERHRPVDACASPPLGIGERTGLRQTTVPLPAGAVACLFTDGLTEARVDGGLLGRERVEWMVEELGPDGTASQLLSRIAAEARSAPDDMAACLLTPAADVTAGGFRSELLELSSEDLDRGLGRRFLEACGVEGEAARAAELEASELAGRFGAALLRVVFGARRTVEASPANVESIEATSRRLAAV